MLRKHSIYPVLLAAITLAYPQNTLGIENVVGTCGPECYRSLTPQEANLQFELTQQASEGKVSMMASSAYIHRVRLLNTDSRSVSENAAMGEQVSAAATFSTPREATDLGSLSGAVAFIRGQTAPGIGNGLPKSFSTPGGVNTGNFVVDEGVNTYDSALALWALLDAGQRQDAKGILDIYTKELFGTMTLRAYPNGNNGFAFAPLTAQSYLLFDTTRASGNYLGWQKYDAHVGPTAWMILAGARYLYETPAGSQPDPSILGWIKALGEGLLILQNNPTLNDGKDHGNSQGGVRFGPTASSNGNAFDEINTENNLSAYAAFQALYKVTKDSKYLQAARKIETFLSQGHFYNPETNSMQTGLMGNNSGGSLLNVHLRYNANLKRWEIEPRYAADSAGTWAISALGADKIDELFGPSKAQAMWATVRQNFGRTLQVGPNGQEQWVQTTRFAPISGVDFSRDYKNDFQPDLNQVIVSPEWTAHAAFAVDQIASQCGKIISPYCSSAAVDRDKQDSANMRDFLAKHAGPYAIGPGIAGSRNGYTGFGFSVPPQSATAMASVYAAFKTDPLAWARQ